MPRRLLLALALLAGPAAAQETRLVLPPGTDPEIEAVLRNVSATLALESEGLSLPQDYVAAARADYRRLLDGLYSLGRYAPVIHILVDGQEAAALQPLEAPPAVREVALVVDPGPLFLFGLASIAPLPPAAELPPAFATGEPARATVIEEAVAEAISAWRDEGNAKAAVASESVQAVHPPDRLDVAIGLDPGPRLAFGPVTVAGNARVRTERILAIAGIPTGQVFDPADLERAASRLRRTGAFDSVALVEAETPAGATLPIAIEVAESLPRRIGFGAEISSLDGLSANAFWLHRNLLGGAERLRFDAEISDVGADQLGLAGGGEDYALGATFTRPATFSPDNDLNLSVRLSQDDEDDYFLRQIEAAATITRYASDDLVLTFGLGFVAAREETVLGVRDYALLTLPLTAILDRRDDPKDARAGYYLGLEATPFLSVSGEGGDGARLYADGRYFRTFGTRVTAAVRGQLGSVVGASRDDVPQDFLFFSGGGGTVRGQPYRSLGVEVPDPANPGDTLTLGGTAFAGIQAEGRVRFTDTWGGVAFADAGYVSGSYDFRDGDWQAGVGLGVRYNSFLGPIRLDLATPASGPDRFGSVQIYVGIGQAF